MNLRKLLTIAVAVSSILLMASSALSASALTYAEISGQGKVLGDATSTFYPYPTGTLVNDSGTVYFISGTTKVPFTNWQAFIGLGYKPKNIVEGDLTNYTPSASYMINTANAAHPWGSWLIYKGTVYYSTQDGLIGVPSAQVFTSNGGDWIYIVKANSYDIVVLNANPNLQLLAVNDSRVTTTPTYQSPANSNSSNQNSQNNQNANFTFSASLSSLSSPIYVAGGATNQRIASFNLSVGNSSGNVNLNSVGIQTASNNVAGNFQNLKVYVNGSPFGTAIQNPSNNTSYSFFAQSLSGSLALTAGQLTSLEVYADVVGSVSINQTIVSLDSSKTYVQTGDYTLNGTVITQLPASVTGQIVVVQSANNTSAIQITVTASANPSTITAGQASTISWNSTNATECGFSYSPNIPANPGNGAFRPSDSAQFTPPQTTDYTVTCSNSSGQSSSAVVRVNVTAATTGSIQINNITMPNGVVGQPYAGTIGWSAPNVSPTTDITVTIDRVGNNNYPLPYFPDGLTLSPNCLAGAPGSSCIFSGLRNNSNGQGQISIGGTPTQTGTYTFTVTLREGQYNTSDTKTVTIVVSPATTPGIQISNVYVPNGKVGQSYYGYIGWSAQNISPTTDLTAIIDRVGNNNYPYPYLPDGLTFTPNCLAGAPGSSCIFSGLSNGQGQIFMGGVPTQAGTYTFTVQVQDNQGHSSGLKTITMTVAP